MEFNGQFSGCTISPHQCRCFEKLSDKELKLVEENSTRIKYKKGELICKQGGFASHVMYIEKGLAKVFLDNGVNSLVLKVIPDGNLLGLTSINQDHNTFQYSAMAYIDSEIKQIDINIFKQLLSVRGHIVLYFAHLYRVLHSFNCENYGFCTRKWLIFYGEITNTGRMTTLRENRRLIQT